MHTQCTTQKCSFKGFSKRRVEAQFTAEQAHQEAATGEPGFVHPAFEAAITNKP